MGYGPEFWKKVVSKLKTSPFSPQNVDWDLRKFLESLREKSKGDRRRLGVLSAILEKNLLPSDLLGKPLTDIHKAVTQ